MGEDGSSVDSMGEDRGSMDSMGEDGGSMSNSNRGSMDSVGEKRSGMSNSNRSVSNSNRGSMSNNSRPVSRLTRVGHVLGDAITIVSIGDSLYSAVREVDGVAARGGISIPLLALGELSSAVVVTHSVVVGVHWGLSKVSRSSHHHGGGVLGEGTGSSHQGGNEKDLHR